ncbi:hypothetical protein IG631_07267 [Alternaria alternata]|nr:hypothetical protein IG631_07267 [Alternaria alternata]
MLRGSMFCQSASPTHMKPSCLARPVFLVARQTSRNRSPKSKREKGATRSAAAASSHPHSRLRRLAAGSPQLLHPFLYYIGALFAVLGMETTRLGSWWAAADCLGAHVASRPAPHARVLRIYFNEQEPNVVCSLGTWSPLLHHDKHGHLG